MDVMIRLYTTKSVPQLTSDCHEHLKNIYVPILVDIVLKSGEKCSYDGKEIAPESKGKDDVPCDIHADNYVPDGEIALFRS